MTYGFDDTGFLELLCVLGMDLFILYWKQTPPAAHAMQHYQYSDYVLF